MNSINLYKRNLQRNQTPGTVRTMAQCKTTFQRVFKTLTGSAGILTWSWRWSINMAWEQNRRKPCGKEKRQERVSGRDKRIVILSPCRHTAVVQHIADKHVNRRAEDDARSSERKSVSREGQAQMAFTFRNIIPCTPYLKLFRGRGNSISVESERTNAADSTTGRRPDTSISDAFFL